MPNPSIVRFDYDPTGVNPDNLVSNEFHPLTDNYVRAFAPTYGPFFADSVVLFDNANDRQLVRGVDFSITELNQDITLRLGKEVSSVVLVLHPSVSDTVRMTYQVVGGLYQNQADAIANMYTALLQDGRPIEWANILGKPLQFPPTLHLHNLEDVYGFEPLVNAIERIRSALILSDVPAFEALIDWIKRRQYDCCLAEADERIAGDNNLLGLIEAEIVARITADDEIRALISSTGGGSGGGSVIPYANTPVIISPANNSAINSQSQVFTCTMVSGDITVGAYFEWQIATDINFTTIISQTTTGTDTYVPSNLPYVAHYYIRVRYVHPSPAITTAWGVTIHCIQSVYANTPVITSPVNNSVNIPLTQIFTCTMVSQNLTIGAYFEWQIATDINFTTILSQTTTGTDTYVPSNLTNGTNLWIRVRYVHPSPAITTAWSAVVKCTTLVLIAPLTEIQVYNAPTEHIAMALYGKVLAYVYPIAGRSAGAANFGLRSYDYTTPSATIVTKVLEYWSDYPAHATVDVVNPRLYLANGANSDAIYGAVSYMELNGTTYSAPRVGFLTAQDTGSPAVVTSWKCSGLFVTNNDPTALYNANTVMGFSNFYVHAGNPDNPSIDFFISTLGKSVGISRYVCSPDSSTAPIVYASTVNVPYPQVAQIPTASEFGKSVYIYRNYDATKNKLIVAAPKDSVITNSVIGPQQGAVYVYNYVLGSGYVVEQILHSPSALANRTRFGNDIGCNGEFLAITEHFTNAPPMVHIYIRQSSQWVFKQTILFTSFMERYDYVNGSNGSNDTEPFNTSNWNADAEISFGDNTHVMMINFKDFYRKVFIFTPSMLPNGEWEFVKDESYKFHPINSGTVDTGPSNPVHAAFSFDGSNGQNVLDMVAIASYADDPLDTTRITVYD